MKFEKNENCNFRKNVGVILDDGNFDSTRTSLHLCITLWGRMVFVSTFTSEKNQLQFGKKWKFFEFFLHPFICPIIPERKKVDVIFTFTHSLLNPRTNYETMDSVFVLGPDIQDKDIQARVKKKWEIFSKKSSIFSRKTKASYLMTKTWLVQKSPHPCYLSWGRMISVSGLGFEK